MKNGPETLRQQRPALTTKPVLEAIMAEAKLCSVEGCGKTVRARGWCVNHYALWERNGEPKKQARATECSIGGCGERRRSKGYCSSHYWRLRQHGDPLKLKEPAPRPGCCKINGCLNPPRGRVLGLCNAHYLRLYRYGDAEAPRLRARNGTPKQWLREHVGYDGGECLIWPFARHTNGEAAIGDRQSRQAARLMCILAHGEPPSPEMQAAHKCGKGHLGCVNPRHLRWRTPKQNTNEKREHGTLLMGEAHPQAKLTAIQVKAIRALAGDFSVPALAEIFGVHAWTISDVVKRRTWTCL